jgi:hypothetical protein
MAAIDQTDAGHIIDATLGTANYTAVAATKTRLGTTAPTATSNMTQLTGTGYTAGGTTTTWNGASAGATTNITAPSWTNGSGSSWSIVGIETWDTAGTPLRHWFGTWNGQPVVISNGSVFTFAAGAVAISLS